MARLEDLIFDPRDEFHGCYKTARGRLAAFLTDLDPLFRRLLTGDHLHPFDNVDFSHVDARGRRHFQEAEKQYFKLLRAVCREGNRQAAHVNAEFLDNAKREAILYERASTDPGAPTKTVSHRLDVRISLEADRVIGHLKPGVLRALELKTRRNPRIDEANIRAALSELGYRPDETAVIMLGRSLRSAAAHYLALPNVYNRPVRTIQASITRGAKIRREADYHRTPKL